MTNSATTIDAIDALLPQTQCQECTYAGCRPYAVAIVEQNETINRCPPGGVATLQALASLLNIDANNYINEVTEQTRAPSRAIIQEDLCIGCTKCIQACPVDAILGSAKFMHSVISSECTGCELCVEPCPMDCIDMQALSKPEFNKDTARQRYESRQLRLDKIANEKQQRHQQALVNKMENKADNESQQKTSIQSEVQAAIARAKAKKQQKQQLQTG